MIAVRFHPDAESEMIRAAAYYEAQHSGLGRRFLTAVQDSINRILVNPKLYPVVEAGTRRSLTRTFPFGIVFREQGNQIVIMAVMHLHREPGYWKGRKE